jgi:hypothetical protein
MIKKFEDYECLFRYIGECKSCVKDKGNLNCSRYYPVHLLGADGIIQNPESARIQKDRLIQLANDTERYTSR